MSKPAYKLYDDVSSDDSSSSSTSSSSEDYQQRNMSRRSGFSTIMDDWYGDADASSALSPTPPPIRTAVMKKQQQQPTMKEKPKTKKKLVPITAPLPKQQRRNNNTPTSKPRLIPQQQHTAAAQRCYLLRGSQTQGSLIEYYTENDVPEEYLAYWTPPAGKQIPKFKFTQNWGKNELVNAATQGDLRGKRSYFSGICQWLRKAKTFNASFRFCNQLPGWECDMYIFLQEAVDGIQTVLVKDGQTFPAAKAEGVAIVSRGSDFLYYDPRFQCGIDKWVSEGSKLGFATKLDVRPGCAYPKSIVSHPSILESQRNSTVDNASSDDGISNGEEQHLEGKKSQTNEIEEEIQQKRLLLSRMTLGTSVYVRDSHYSWIPATIESEPDDKKKVQVKVKFPNDWEEYTTITKGGEAGKLKLERTVNLSDYPNEELPLQNLEADGVSAARKNDMADLTNLHEAAILYNLKARHSDGNPYTRVGDIMVAVNPFQWINGLYSEEKRSFYAKNLIWQTSSGGAMKSSQLLATAAAEKQALGYEYEKLGIKPHVYETSSLSYLGLAMDKSDQTILVTGESGAGKTETIKIVMNHLATVEGTRPSSPLDLVKSTSSEHGAGTVERVLRANPLFEAFGNAKTLRNDNSSRFGKFTQLQFDVEDHDLAQREGRHIPICELAGSKCITYLLEKSRVVSVSEGERTFHIFYQMLGAPDTDKEQIWKEGLVGFDTSDFAYLRNVPANNIDGLASGDNWSETVDALSIFGIHDDLFLHLMRSLCVILQLGNLTFGMDVVEGEERSTISSPDVLSKLSSIMGVSEQEIESAMTKRSFSMRGEEVTIALKDNEAKDGCDALAKEIYARVFDLLVAKINDRTEPRSSPTHGTDYGTISLLDIFGFESFTVNRFEQLCINYANERLQQKYVGDNFQAIKSEYEDEGINVFDFSLIDNSHVMELLEGKLGLITQLNEECVKKNGEDENFVYKFNLVNSDSSSLIQNPLHRNYEFAVRHYAAPIKYDARKFIERNLDKIPADLLKCACKSTNPLIREEFQQLSSKLEAPKSAGPKKRSEATKHFVVTKFKHQLTSLMSLIEDSRTRYIRCVKPNKSSRPKIMDHTHTVSQLESAGLVTAIIISRESFPNRLSYELVLERFRFLSYKFDDCRLGCGNVRKDAEELLNHLLKGISADTHSGKAKAFACGKTKVYFRAGALEMIETIRQEHYAKAAIRLQAWIRPISLKQIYQKARRGIILLQSEVRRLIASKSLAKMLRSALVIQCFFRKALASMEITRRRENHAATIIQTRWRGMKPKVEFSNIRVKTIQIQSMARMMMAKKTVSFKRKEREEQSAMDTRMSIIQQNFDDATTVGGGTVFSVDEGLLEEVETMFEFLRKEIVVLRKKNTKLKKELAESESDKRELFNQASSTDHALALSKIRNDQMSKTNMTLLDDNNRRRKESTKLKNELKTQQEAHESQLQDMRVEFDSALTYREVEMQSLQLHLQSLTAQHERELDALRRDCEGKQEEHYNQIARLHDEVKSTQNTHEDYLSKLMNVLETTQRSSILVAAPPDINVLREKDEEIAKLKKELSRLRDTSSATGSNGSADTPGKQEATKAMKYIVKKNREQRKKGVQQIETIVNDFDESLASGYMARSQNLIKSLNEAVQAGEKANSRMDREMVTMIDKTTSYLPSSNDDALRLAAENEKLRRKLAKKVCKNCGNANARQKSTVEDEAASGSQELEVYEE
mmetsp:Transcript_30439/g.61074  ORF Transcript_30439/g.61074 Transcript_30439/m.61074 type:complete len:1725 (+) Transcript_30439:85-5259(+)